ncbi:hypothetical protein OQI89_12975 [Lentilactobacillus diolivorans]|uniref:hypothetical protein n=1 Tax=Lentilactobacillus diolivorans TaxID=179838 RepID=UPI0024689897|nr:hypothetical protein [Lentilactobacillus diolivorans]MDH5106766.1 hypothetical protein [Lentilactobacillus diolivorans]
MPKKTNSRLPKWLRDTLQTATLIVILMVLYNLIGPLVYKNGSYFPWWTVPYSVVSVYLIIGAWNFMVAKLKATNQKLVDEENRQKQKQVELRQQNAAKQQGEAEKRRQRNQQHQTKSR